MQFESQNIPCVTIGKNKKIKDSIGMYRKFKVPMRVLLTDFLAVKSKYDVLAAAENAWASFFKGEGHEVESGVSVDETLFRFAAMSLKDQNPTDVINAAFYANKVRNDYDFELGYLLPLFKKSIAADNRILVVNPSPYVISCLEESKPCGERYYAVTDNTVAGLYHLQFPDGNFCTFEQLKNIKDIDKVLIINRDLKNELAQLILTSLFCCNEKASVIGMVPCIWFDNPDSGVYLILKEAHFSLKQVLLVDSKATASVPRKKMIMILEKGEKGEIEVTQSVYDNKSRYFSVTSTVQIDADLYLKSKKTILACLKTKEKQSKEEKTHRYSKAEEYQFSPEISLFYKIYSERKNKFAGVAYYREIKDVKLKTWGKKLTSDIEKGLRANTKDEVVARFEDMFFKDDVYPLIWNDIKVKYIENKNVISLKTIWFYCWCYISNMKRYDHKYLSQLFSKSEIANVLPQDATGDSLIRAIAHALKVEVDAIPYRAIEQIDLILKNAVKHKILIYNPLELYVSDYTTRATERQQDVRNALVKKHFSSDEEMRIFRAIVGSENKDDARVPNCIQKSLLLAGAIRLFTGMAIRETAALKWDDYKPIRGTDAFQFTITKFVDNKGKIVQHSASENWKRFRIVPIAKVLSYLLNERKRYLLSLGIDEGYLMECPIILQNECITDMQNKKSIEHSKPEKISTICKEIINHANIPMNEVVLPDAKSDLITDFNRYHGDVFLSNFRHKANHTAYMTMGEINYMIGVNAPDTFSRHYCDYSNDLLQFAVVQKLRRWESCYEAVVTGNNVQEPAIRIIEGSMEFEIGPFLGGVTVADLLIETTDSSDVEVSVSSPHGIRVNTTVY